MSDLSYDQIDALVDVDPIALRDVAWKLMQDVARLEAERDEALRLERQAAHELGLTVAERDEARAAQLRLLRELTATCSCGTSPMTYEGPEPDCAVHGAIRAFNEAATELARMRPVYDAAVAWRRNVGAVEPQHEEYFHEYELGLIAAVDQTTPSSPQETPHTADDGEAGVVEGAGGSEAAEADERPELVAFVEDRLGVTLTPWQRDLLAPKPATMNATQPPMPSAGSWLELKRNG